MVVPRCEFGLCGHDGNLYAFGGWVGEGIGGTIERYDVTTNTWAESGAMLEPRFRWVLRPRFRRVLVLAYIFHWRNFSSLQLIWKVF